MKTEKATLLEDDSQERGAKCWDNCKHLTSPTDFHRPLVVLHRGVSNICAFMSTYTSWQECLPKHNMVMMKTENVYETLTSTPNGSGYSSDNLWLSFVVKSSKSLTEQMSPFTHFIGGTAFISFVLLLPAKCPYYLFCYSSFPSTFPKSVLFIFPWL
jgi:hypothetical protein